MAQMATPWKHPETGSYYLRRQIPEALRPAFGGKALYKASLRTKNFAKAAQLFTEANAALERQFEVARERLELTGDPRPSQEDECARLITTYFEGGATEGGLDGPERLVLAFLEGDRLLYQLADGSGDLYDVPSGAERWESMTLNAALFRAERDRLKRTASARPGKFWKMIARAGGFEAGRAIHADRVVEQICSHHGLSAAEVPDGLPEAIIRYLDEATLEHKLLARKPRHASPRLEPQLRLAELHDRWKQQRNPSEQCSREYRRSVDDFIDYIGDLPVAEITEDDLLTYRDAVAEMPRTLPHVDRKLSFSERHAKHRNDGTPRVTGTTVKKRVGGVQALLSFAKRKRWITKNVGAGLGIDDDLPKSNTVRRSFLTSELEALFQAPLFTSPLAWRIKKDGVSDSSMFFLFLMGLTSGARIEELGQAALADAKFDGRVAFIDIDEYVEDEGASKSIKNDDSRRIIPLHDVVIGVGFMDYVAALKEAGHRQLFPDLKVNSVGKRTQAASQRANRIIDKHVTKDRRIVFHSFRHTFKQRGTTARIPERILDQLCGHAPTSVGKKYGLGQPLRVLHEELHKIDFSCVDAAKLFEVFEDFDWEALVAKLPTPKNV